MGHSIRDILFFITPTGNNNKKKKSPKQNVEKNNKNTQYNKCLITW